MLKNLIDNENAETARTFVLGAWIGGCLYGGFTGTDVAIWIGLALFTVWVAWTLTRRAVLGERADD